MSRRLICIIMLLLSACTARADWVVRDTQTTGKMSLDGQKGTIANGGHLTVTGTSMVEGGGELLIDGGTLEYNARRFNINDGTFTIRDGAASFNGESGIMVCDDYGPSNINVLGGVMYSQKIETRQAYRGGLITIGGGTLRVEYVVPDSSIEDPWQWWWDGIMVPDTANGYTEIIIKPWGNSGAEVTAGPRPRIVEIGKAVVAVYQEDLALKMGTYSHQGDVSGNKVVFAHGPDCDFTWDIKCKDLETEKRTFYKSGNGNKGKTLDLFPKIDGDIIVWSGGPLWTQAGGTWGHEPLNMGVIAVNTATGAQRTLRRYTMSESYSRPVISGSKVAWIEHLGLDTSPIGSSEAKNWYNTPYNICGADITNMESPVYFTIATDVGNRDPYSGDFDDGVDIDGNIVVWEGKGDIYGGDVSDVDHITVFTICADQGRQSDPAISGNIVVWSDQRNDPADIYGADISDPDNIRVFEIVRKEGMQQQPAVSDRMIVYIDSSDGSYGGELKVCLLTAQEQVMHIPLEPRQHGMGPAIDGPVIVWLDDYYGKAQGMSLRVKFIVAQGNVQNVTSRQRYDYIQDAIDEAAEGNEIVLGPGTYSENIDFSGKNLTVRSESPDNSAAVGTTVIEGNGDGPAVTFSGGEGSSCLLSGFTITAGNGGISILNRITSPVITNCVITANRGDGVQFAQTAGRPEIKNCVITKNQGDGVRASASPPIITNCTVADNTGAGIRSSNRSRPVITNCIVWNNAGPAIECTDEATVTVTYSNTDADPCFADPANADYHLRSHAGRWDPKLRQWVSDAYTSPCIDAGNADSDWTRELWPNGKCINMGAYGGTSQASMSQSNFGNIADVNNDGAVDHRDLSRLADVWLVEAVLLAEDINRNGRVNLRDLAGLALHWLWASQPQVP